MIFRITIIIFCFSLCFYSCSNSELEDLEKQITELENQDNKYVILENVTARSQSAIELLGEKKIKGIKGIFTISGYDVVDLSPLDSLQEVGELIIDRNPNLKNLNGLGNLAFIEHDLKISNNDSLQNLDGLSEVKILGGNLQISSNYNLGSFCGIKELWKESNFQTLIYSNKINPSSWEVIVDCN